MLEVGKLYTCEEYFLLLYPDQKTAYAAAAEAAPAAVHRPVIAAYWSNRFGKNVSCTEKNIPILVLNNKKEYIEVLSGDRKGWIVYQDWLKIKEIDNV